jgi:hypothetical protein
LLRACTLLSIAFGFSHVIVCLTCVVTRVVHGGCRRPMRSQTLGLKKNKGTNSGSTNWWWWFLGPSQEKGVWPAPGRITYWPGAQIRVGQHPPPYNTKSKGSTGASLLLFNIINRRRGATRK